MYTYPRKWLRSIQSTYNTINSANLSGAIDIIVVKQDDGTLRCTPFHVRFGKLSVMQASQKDVDIAVNDQNIDFIRMQLGDAGEALFINDIDTAVADPSLVSTDIAPQSELINKEFDGQSSSATKVDVIKPPDETSRNNGHRRDHEKRRIVRHNLDASSSEDEQQIKDPLSTKRKSYERKPVSMLIANVDDNKISFSSNQEQSDNNESIDNGQSENDELIETETTNISSNPILINLSSAIKRAPKLAIKSNTTKNNIFEPVLSQSVPLQSPPPITNSSFSIPINETDNPISNIQSDTEYEFDKSTQSLINTQRTLANKIISIWQWKWGELPQQQGATQFIKRSTNFLSKMWTSRKTTTSTESTEDIQPDNIASNRCSGSSPDLSTMNSYQSQSQTIDDGNSPDIQFSLCGSLNNQSLITDELFNKHLVSFETFANNLDIISNPNLIVRVDGKFFTWTMASSLFPSIERRASIDNKECIKTTTVTSLTNKVEMKPTTFESQLSVEKTENDHNMKMKEKLQLSSSSTTTTSSKILEKTMILSSDQLKRLDLKMGLNKVKFSVITAIQGSQDVEANVFLFDQNTKFVISDIDGTITKSDVVGHISAWFGVNWAHDGIAQCFNAIQENGYRFIYLSARAIGQSQMTREFLSRIEQCKCPLPPGPLLVSPDSLMTALYREIIAKKPEEFKIECLKNIANLFPNKNPFYAGFGNRPNDQDAYTTVGIPATHIFTINPQSIIFREKLCRIQSYSYKILHDIVDLIFPPLDAFSASESYSTFTYWRNNPATDTFDDEIQAQINEINEREKRSKTSIIKRQKPK